MLFRTEIHLAESEQKIQAEDRIFSIGSCFASEMTSIFALGQLQTLSNPFGTIFHPVAINNAIKRIYDGSDYTEEDFIFSGEKYISLDHHSSFDNRYLHKALTQINTSLAEAREFLRESKWIIITYGTSWVYEFIEKQKIVANCHKIPQKHFTKRLLSHLEVADAMAESVNMLRDITPKDAKILFTISPVRHIKDGLVENQRSKSLLINAVHEIVDVSEQCEYLPIYEILMDDLRDYRFYKEDLIHPNGQAIHYIWEKFSAAYLAKETDEFIKENRKINQALAHKPFDEKSEEYKLFHDKIKERIAKQQEKVRHKIFGS